MEYKESKLQQNCITWFKYQYPNHVLYAIPNGGKRNLREASRLKAEGVLAGVSDLFLMKPSNGYHGLFIEMKAGKGKQTDNQIEFEKMAKKEGYDYRIARSLPDFQNIIEGYLGTYPLSA